jgi:RNA polymerase sigma factor (sigma-70 family)
MGDLRENDRRVLEMRLQGWTQDEIARELDCTERTVRRTLDRIRSLAEDQNIREQLME